MPLYRMIIHGQGKFTDGIVGFYTARWCCAATEDLAIEKIQRRLNKEWTVGKSARMNQGGPIDLEVEQIWQIGFLEIFATSNRGYTFYL